MDVKLQSAKLLSPGEEKSIDQTISDCKDILDEKELMQGVNFEAKNKAEIQKKISDLEQLKRTHGLPELSDGERQKVSKELEALEAKLQVGMPTWDEYVGLAPKHGPRYTALVTKIQKWEADPVRRQMVLRWKTLRRLRDPHDPQAGNTMYLFPQS